MRVKLREDTLVVVGGRGAFVILAGSEIHIPYPPDPRVKVYMKKGKIYVARRRSAPVGALGGEGAADRRSREQRVQDREPPQAQRPRDLAPLWAHLD
jgi:hypothetical protein